MATAVDPDVQPTTVLLLGQFVSDYVESGSWPGFPRGNGRS
jgi:hypothetical protein